MFFFLIVFQQYQEKKKQWYIGNECFGVKLFGVNVAAACAIGLITTRIESRRRVVEHVDHARLVLVTGGDSFARYVLVDELAMPIALNFVRVVGQKRELASFYIKFYFK